MARLIDHEETRKYTIYSVPNCCVLFLKRIYSIQFSTGTPAEKRPLGRPKRRWEDNIRMDLKEIGISTRDWVDTAKGKDYWRAPVNAALNLRVP